MNFSIRYIQYLNPEGELVNLDQVTPEIISNPDHLLKLYSAMVLARTFDTKAVALQRTGRMGTYPSALGQEAVSIAMADPLLPDDVYVPYYRDVSGMFLRGIKMEEILLYWGGDERGSDYAIGNKDFPICVPIATQCLHAAGVAAAFKYKKQKNVCITAIGDGGTSKGDFYEALNVAGTWQLPVVFVINNNQWAISVPRKKQTGCPTLAQKGIAAGINSIQVDGNDMIALQYWLKYAVDQARNNKGPMLIEAITYRMGDHTTADDASRYRSKTEVEVAATKDPIQRLYNYLVNKNLWTATQENNLIKSCQEQVEQAVNNYLNLAPQPPTAMFDYHYAKWPESYQDQRQAAIDNAHLASGH
ncbi:MAG: pyruvate dehydrogenase (acetyl-transferring) E1 component subunit alpha [Gammaproteobacteria bacterium]|nr:pyruvate dehydrogenase (acetyl-transferring) E1 component subunit alpha [Gammaproteobacteria bacterium]